MQDPISKSPDSTDQADAGTSPLEWGKVALLALSGTFLGGLLGGLAIDRFGSMGAIAIWAIGGLLGWIASKTIEPSRNSAWLLASSVVLALLVAEVCWIHWNFVNADTWIRAIQKLPAFIQDYQMDVLVAGLMTFFGASSAYRQSAHRYEYLRVIKR